jgi:outer membrane protein
MKFSAIIVLMPVLCLSAPVLALDAAVPPVPAAEPAETPLTLQDALKIALTRHGDIAQSRESLEAARQRVRSARSANVPQVTGTIASDYANSRSSSTPVVVNGVTSTLTTGIAVSQNLFDSGRIRNSVRQAQVGVTSSVAGLGTNRGSLAFTVSTNFFEQLRQAQLITQREAQVKLAEQQIAQIQARIQEGAAPAADLAGVRVTLSQARFDLVTARNAFRTSAQQLRNSLGLESGPPLELAANETTLGTPTELPALEDLLATARRLRPDLLAARASVRSSQIAVSSARIEERPSVAATAGVNLDPRATDDHRLTVGATLTVPLFNGGGRRADVRAAQNDLDAAQLRLTQLEKDADTEVTTAYVDITGQTERVRNAEELVQSAQVNLDTATARYQEGAGIALDIQNAQQQLFEAQTSLTSARFDLELARANLDRALGRYAWADPDQTPPERAPGE